MLYRLRQCNDCQMHFISVDASVYVKQILVQNITDQRKCFCAYTESVKHQWNAGFAVVFVNISWSSSSAWYLLETISNGRPGVAHEFTSETIWKSVWFYFLFPCFPVAECTASSWLTAFTKSGWEKGTDWDHIWLKEWCPAAPYGPWLYVKTCCSDACMEQRNFFLTV